MARALELVIGGLALGGIYALLAFALSLTISTTRILNVAHGVFFVWGGAAFILLSQHLRLHPALSILILIAFFFAFALLFQWGIVRPLLGRSVHLLLIGSIMATFGLGLSMESILGYAWVTYVDPYPVFTSSLAMFPLTLGGIALSGSRLVILGFVLVMVIGFHLFLQKTFLGKGARAMAQNFDGFLVIGLNPYRLSRILFTLAIVATAVSGAFYVLAVPLSPYEGLPLDPEGVHGGDPRRGGQPPRHPGGGCGAGAGRGAHQPVPRHDLGARREPRHPVPGARRQAHRLLREGRLLMAVTVGAVGVLCVLPAFLSSSWLLIMFLSFVWLIMTANYDVLDGFLGHINLGQGAFFGLGAYVATILLNTSPVQRWGGLAFVVITVAALAVAALFAAVMAFPLFRLKGLYFAIGTLILIFLLQVLALNLGPLTGGSYGLYVPPAFFMSTVIGYYLALLLAIASVGLNFYLSRSALGLALRCIKEDEAAAGSIGLDLMKYKTIALVISSLPTAGAGVLFALNSGFIDPTIALGVERSLLPPLMAILGGAGTVLGPVFGTAIIRILETVFFHYLRLPVPSMLFFGLTLLAVALCIPEGLLKSPRMKRLAWFRAFMS